MLVVHISYCFLPNQSLQWFQVENIFLENKHLALSKSMLQNPKCRILLNCIWVGDWQCIKCKLIYEKQKDVQQF